MRGYLSENVRKSKNLSISSEIVDLESKQENVSSVFVGESRDFLALAGSTACLQTDFISQSILVFWLLI